MTEVTWTRAKALSVEEKQKELTEVLDSSLFAKSEQLRSFLRYVCTKEIEGRAHELNEYLVGTEALHRSSNYSPGEDSSVRSRAWELRNKLLKLYSTERQASEVRIDLPKGGYAPFFLVRTVVETTTPALASDGVAEQVAQENGVHRTRTRASWIHYAISGVSLLVAAVFATLFFRRPAPLTVELPEVIRAAWGPLIKPNASDLVVLSNGYYLLIRPNISSNFRSHPQYPAPPELYDLYRQKRPLDPKAKLTMFPSGNTIQVGYANGLVSLTNLLEKAAVNRTVSPERVLTLSALRDHNVLLLGAPQDSIFADDLLRDAEYTFGYDPAHDIVIYRKGQKLADSPYFVALEQTAHSALTYGLITVLPSLGSEAANKRTVVFSGITSVGGQGAAEFFSSPKLMEQVKSKLKEEGFNEFPPAYQILVRCRSFDSLLTSLELADVAVSQRK